MIFDVMKFLQALVGRPGAAVPTAADLPADWHLLWDERAAIMQYDAKLSRDRAEALALVDIHHQMKQASNAFV
jgi:hypothetical protein